MNVPASLLPLVDDGIIEEVVRPLMSGKEAQVYLVVAGGTERVAKVYKDAQHRSFKHRADYTEGRRTRNSRDQRAVARRTKHGRSQDEAAWRSTEVDMIYRLRAAGVRVPEPYIFSDGVLVMEFITDAAGFAAPRLGDANLSRDEAVFVFEALMQEVIRMLCAGVVHGDLSDFNVLLGERGPVVIDFPQAMDAASNRNARNILIRDVDNLHNFLSRCSRDYRPKPFAQEMWALFERGELLPDTKLRGLYRPDTKQADVGGLLREIGDARRDAVRAGLAQDDEDTNDQELGSSRRPGDGERPAAGGPGGPPRRRVEVVVSRGTAPGQRPARDGAPGAGGFPPRGAAGSDGRGRERDGARGIQGRPPAPPAPSARPTNGARPSGGGRRGAPVDTQALLAAQPAVTDAQREKAAQIAEAARAAQAARAARGKAPRPDAGGGRSDPRARGPKGQASGARGPAAQEPRSRTQGVERALGKSGAPVANGTEPQKTSDAGDAPAKRRRRRRRGRSGGASSEPKP
ncbi:MAG: hypothetical protein H6725_15515 [Sandaracinaceae bacterium]|nr:hypothetical protein [Sandaracinaceae bacterium]